MNILVIGGGGREHALVQALKKSAQVSGLWCAPGNAGIESDAKCVPLDPKDHAAVTAFLQKNQIGLTVIGPEGPLVEGLADAIQASGRKVFGPGRAAARLEGSKVFAKGFMKTYGIPTAEFRAFSYPEEAVAFVKSAHWKDTLRVVKASGLAAGKGVILCADRGEVLKALEEAMVKKAFGAAGDQVVLEEMLAGEELSLMALCDGGALLPLVPSQDHKRVFDNDQGPNTGGMGAYAPVPQVSDELLAGLQKSIFTPFLHGLREEGLDYCGVIYFGLMLTREGPKVLEFNARFGDPETQVILPLLDNDIPELFLAAADRRLGSQTLKIKNQSAVCVVMTAKGYPGPFEKGKTIRGLDAAAGQKGVQVFHAGTVRNGNEIQTAGGRVLGVTALGANFDEARDRAYQAVRTITFDGAHFREDIGSKALRASTA